MRPPLRDHRHLADNVRQHGSYVCAWLLALRLWRALALLDYAIGGAVLGAVRVLARVCVVDVRVRPQQELGTQ